MLPRHSLPIPLPSTLYVCTYAHACVTNVMFTARPLLHLPCLLHFYLWARLDVLKLRSKPLMVITNFTDCFEEKENITVYVVLKIFLKTLSTFLLSFKVLPPPPEAASFLSSYPSTSSTATPAVSSFLCCTALPEARTLASL